jgi:hypothetical protein
MIIAFTLVVPSRSSAQAPSQPYELSKPDYQAFLIDRYADLTRSMNDAVFTQRAQSDPRRVINFAEYALSLHDATGEQRYVTDAKRAWDALLGKWRMNLAGGESINRPNDFFINAGLLHVYEELHELGLVDADDVPILRQVMRANNYYQKGDNNQAIYRAIGLVQSVRLFPDEPNAQLWRQYADEVWNYWYAQRDITENASHYSSISLNAAIKLTRLSGREELMAAPEIRKVFERYRDQVSPTGAMPEYGDDYFGEALEWIEVFEYAARTYNDPTYLDAAWKVYWFLYHHYKLEATGNFDTDLWSMVQYASLTGLLELQPTALQPSANPVRSRVLTRNEPGKTDSIDKLVLATSRTPGSPFLMSELFGRGFHSHLNRVGAIQYIETDGKPHYHGMARHNKGATHSNVVAVMSGDAAQNYPFGNKTFEPDKWYHETVPASMLITSDTEDNTVRFGPLNLRLQASTEVDFIIDNLRIEGPAGTRMIDTFEDLAKWTRRDNPYSPSTDSTEGSQALRVRIKPGASAHYTAFGWEYESDPEALKPGYDVDFSLDEYNVIKYDWKYKAPNAVDFSIIFRMIVDTNTGIDTVPGDVNNVPVVSQARTEDSPQDAYGEYTLSQYVTHDTILVRKMVLTQEGFLVVQDRLEPGASADGYVAGPVWQTYAPGDRGKNWFDTPSESLVWKMPDGTPGTQPNLLIWMGEAEDRTFGVNKNIEIANNPAPAQTVYAKQPLAAGQAVTFVSVLMPHQTAIPAEGIAEAIRIEATNDGRSTVVLPVPGASPEEVTVTIGSDGWKVKRSGDLDEDGRFTGKDMELALARYRMTSASPDWEQIQDADIDKDGLIGIADLAFIAAKLEASDHTTAGRTDRQ